MKAWNPNHEATRELPDTCSFRTELHGCSTCASFIDGYENVCVKKQRHRFAEKGPSSQSYGFSRSHTYRDVRVGPL